jgi:hypothetical protein
MEPSKKSSELESVIKDVLGIDRIASIKQNKCIPAPIGCGQDVQPETWDYLTQKEFTISGLCADCQDAFFDHKSSRVALEPARQFYTPTENDFVVGRLPMVCGSAEAESRRYHKYVGKSGKIWLVADQPDAAANVYVEGGPNSDGFGGRTLTFTLVDGTELKLKGPWHANSDSLFQDTGIDVRDKHYTFVVIIRGRESGKQYESIMMDVLYKDDEPQLGSFHRGDLLAREWAQGLGAPVFLYSQSSGGSSCGQVKPDAKFYWERDSKATTELSAAQDAIVRM